MKRNILGIAILIATFFGNISSYAQFNLTRPDIISPSPEAMAIQRYGDYPVSLNTGMVDISIPLYEIKTRELSLPISISFHASGRKVNDVNGILGLGWVLNAGGIITRSINDMPDESNSFPAVTSTSIDILREVADDHFAAKSYLRASKSYDGGRDIFSYSLPSGQSGYFILNGWNGSDGGRYDVVKIPYSAVDIEHPGSDSIIITDVDGTLYIYGDDATEKYYKAPHLGTTTAWLLKKIISPSRKDSIVFTYKNENIEKPVWSYTYPIDNITVTDKYSDGSSNNVNEMNKKKDGSSTDYNSRSYSVNRVSRIDFNDGQIDFFYSGDSLFYKMEVRDKLSRLIKRIDFLSTDAQGDYGIKYLRSLTIRDDNESMGKYNFSYHSHSSSMSNKRSMDWWGYFNGKSNETLIPRQNPYPTGSTWIGESYNGSRDSDENAMMKGMLKSITYPTGESTSFTYEANRYLNGLRQEKVGGGLRIKRVESGSNPTVVKTYSYEPGNMGAHLMPENLVNALCSETWVMVKTCSDAGESSCSDKAHYRKRIYTGHMPSQYLVFGSSLITYDKVTEFFGTEANNIGKVEYFYTNPDQTTLSYRTPWGSTGEKKYVNSINQWQKGRLNRKITYKTENGIYIPATDLVNQYGEIDGGGRLNTLIAYRYFEPVRFAAEGSLQDTNYKYMEVKDWGNDNSNGPLFYYAVDEIQSRCHQLEKVVEKTCFNGVCSHETYTEYKYDPNTMQVKLKKSVGSDGRAIETHYTYAPDHVDAYIDDHSMEMREEYNEAYKLMVKRHMVSLVMNEERYVGGGFVEKMLNRYANPYDGIISLDAVYTKYKDNPIEKRLDYIYNSRGNPCQISQKGGMPIVYLWGYKGQHPIAEIKNATYEQVKTTIGESSIVRISEQISLATSDENLINSLRNRLPNAEINTYTYQPLVGIKTHTDPRGVKTTYDYDDYGQLARIRDNSGNVLQSYEYNYVNR